MSLLRLTFFNPKTSFSSPIFHRQTRRLINFEDRRSVLVVGEEIEALSCALILKNRFGLSPTIVSDGLRPSPDEGIVIPINGHRILRRIQVDGELESKGMVLRKFIKTDSESRVLGDIDYSQIASFYQSACVAISRNRLLKILENSLAHQFKLNIQRNTQILSLRHTRLKNSDNNNSPDGQGSQLKVECEMVNEKGLNQKSYYDYVIGADGPLSRVADLVWSKEEIVQKVILGKYSTILPWNELPLNDYFELWGKEAVLGMFPLSHNSVAVFVVFPVRNHPELKDFHKNVSSTVSPSEAVNLIKDWEALKSPPFSTVLDLLRMSTSMNYEAVIERVMESPPAYHRIGLIGTAVYGSFALLRGHHLGLALEDALTVSECISYSGIGSDLALRKYVTAQSPRWDQVRTVNTNTSLSVSWGSTHPPNSLRSKFRVLLEKLDNSSKRLSEKEALLVSNERMLTKPDELLNRK